VFQTQPQVHDHLSLLRGLQPHLGQRIRSPDDPLSLSSPALVLISGTEGAMADVMLLAGCDEQSAGERFGLAACSKHVSRSRPAFANEMKGAARKSPMMSGTVSVTPLNH
jgi:hypothetical protein